MNKFLPLLTSTALTISISSVAVADERHQRDFDFGTLVEHASNNSERAPTSNSDLDFVYDILAPDLLLLTIGLSAAFGLLLLAF